MKNMKLKNWSNSSFWLDNDFTSSGNSIFDDVEAKPKGLDLLKLAGYRRAIANFVSIVTGESIPVQFSGSESYTDGKRVNISAKLSDNDFDPAVGLALHEGSHIKLTDFDVMKNMEANIPMHLVHMITEKYIGDRDDGQEIWLAKNYIMGKMKDLLNIVEDRRIDNFIYKSAPGYRGYYEALYDKYFNAKIVDKGLLSDELTANDWDSYMFRICNITNPNRRLDIMNFRTIWNILDLKNIGRLESSQDALDVAYEIFVFVESQIPKPIANKEEENCNCAGEGEGQSEDVMGEFDENGDAKEPKGDAPADDGSKAEGEEAKSGDGRNIGTGELKPEDREMLSRKDLDRLKKAITKQEQFINEEIKKKKLSKKDARSIKAMEEAGIETKDIKYQVKSWDGELVDRNQEVYIIKNVTQSLIDSNQFPNFFNEYPWRAEERLVAVKEGMILGKMLGKKLKVRAEEKNLKFNRLRSGKIDNRMLASCGYGNESIFEKIESFAYNPGILHISIDNSGSMHGSKLRQAMKTTAAVAKACSMIENMDVVVSFRAADNVGSNRNMYLPVIATIYDSRKDHLNKLVKIMPQVESCGTTPEGLCFEAVMDDILQASKGKDAYFLNFSDGMPWFQNYSGEGALNHTKKQVKKMRREGIKVISYFIGGGYSNQDTMEDFKTMYGKDAQYINTNNVISLAKTMNNKFLEIA
tara:strand:+ start:41 stop:2131 length:2091 start_codon:yes stop_codon:yes gene_type:complete